MRQDEPILDRFENLNVWKQGDQRAPHKPLLVLYALGQWQQGHAGILFRDAEPDLASLLKEFGPPRRSDHPEQPFWRLQRDGVWIVEAPTDLPLKLGDTIPRIGALRSNEVRGAFVPEVQAALAQDPTLAAKIASRILERHFPESLHQDILNAVGLTLVMDRTYRKRDGRFRQRVLTAYEYRCAVCGFDIRLASVSIAIDAAHIRWHQAGGPDTENNGLALCVLHHKIFDLGAFTVTEGRVIVSDQANGSTGLQEHLLAFNGQPIRTPQRPEWTPQAEHVGWHGREVFKGKARYCA